MNTTRNISRLLILIFAIAMIFLEAPLPVRAAAGSVNLPASVTAIAVDGTGNESYFNTQLSNVPSGYDVTNSTYLGWCIDYSVTMTRNEVFQAYLYSSLNPPAGQWFTARWDMVNYILNHKQGNSTDIQSAIWYFINGTSSYNGNATQPLGSAMVNDALANGTGFAPNAGQTAAVILLSLPIIPGSGPFQDSVIEVQTQPVNPGNLTVNITVSGNAESVGANTYHMDSGASATFTANVAGGIQPYIYVWYVNGTARATDQSMDFTAQQTGTYIINVNVTDSSNPAPQADSAIVTVTIPEYSFIAILLLAALIPVAIIFRRKRDRI